MSDLEARPYQRESIDAILGGWRQGLKRCALVLPTGSGKGHTLSTEIPTPDGLKTVGDLVPGDYVYGRNGHSTRVTGVYDRGVLDTYLVTMKHGQLLEVDGDHLWQVQRKGRKPRVVSTRWLASQPMKDRDGYLWAVPVGHPVVRPTLDLPLDPYVVGALVANGGMTHSGTVLTTPDDQVVERVSKHVQVTRLGVYAGRTCPAYQVLGVTSVTKRLGMRTHSKHKRIPAEYLEGSIPQRVDLLQGLLDGDGSVRHGGRRSVLYSTVSFGLADDIVELVTSLGGTCSISTMNREHEGKPTEYSLNILLPTDIDPFSTGRRSTEEFPNRVFHPREAIVRVEPHRQALVRCISVAAPDRLYMVTRSHIVTHNTVVFSMLVAEIFALGLRSLILVHRDELVKQTVRKLRGACDLTVGVVKAERNELHCDVTVASVQTLSRDTRLAKLPPRSFNVIVVDECHHAEAASYRKILEYFGCFVENDPHCVALGVTATLERGDGKGLGGVWQDVVYEKDILWMIAHGYLCDVRGRRVTVEDFDLSGVEKRGGDFTDNSLGYALLDSNAAAMAARGYLEHARMPDGSLRRGVIFTPDVASTYWFAEVFAEAGIPTEAVVGSTPYEDRELIYKRQEVGETAVISSAMVLTEGWDAPYVSCAVMARPTKSRGLYVQMAGRVLRPFPGKPDALILDVTGVTGDHQLRSIPDLTVARDEITMRGDESLFEAAVRELEDELDDRPETYDGLVPQRVGMKNLKINTSHVDLFKASSSLWLQTGAQTWFIPTIHGYVFLAPETRKGKEAGTWLIGKTQGQHRKSGRHDQLYNPDIRPRPQIGPDSWGWLRDGMTLDYAMAIAEHLAGTFDQSWASVTKKDAAWRQRNDKPTDGQRAALGKVRLPVPATRNEASNALSVHYASMLLDEKR